MLLTFAVLLLFQCLGEAVVFVVKLPIPGPVAGMLLLLAVLLVWPKLMNRLEATANELLRHLALLFVPAGVGIIVSAGSLQGHWLAVICSVLISTVLTLSVTASVMRYLMARNSVQAGNNDAQ
ncbi:holin-like protein [Oxalobacteraceae bacterium GrIS 1.18]